MTPSKGKIEWAVYTRTGGGFIATPDPPERLRRYCWVNEDGVGWYKEVGQAPVLLGKCKNITEAVEKSRKLG